MDGAPAVGAVLPPACQMGTRRRPEMDDLGVGWGLVGFGLGGLVLLEGLWAALFVRSSLHADEADGRYRPFCLLIGLPILAGGLAVAGFCSLLLILAGTMLAGG